MFLKIHVQCISRVSLATGGNRLCHLKEEIIDSRSDQFLHSTTMTIFFLSPKETQEHSDFWNFVCRKEKLKQEMWPFELFWAIEVREILYPAKLDVLSLSSLHSIALLKMNSKVKFWSICATCIPIISLPCSRQWVFNASGIGLSVWKSFIPIYIFLDMTCSLETNKQEFTCKSQQPYLESCLNEHSFAQSSFYFFKLTLYNYLFIYFAI